MVSTVLVAATGSVCLADGYSHSGKGFAPPADFSWTGLYVGGQAGLLTGNTQGEVPGAPFLNTDYDFDGGLYGGHVGYNYQSGQWVLGIEGTYSGSQAQGNTSCVFNVFTCQRELNWIATIEGRLGYAFGRSLLYARGGWAWGELDTTVSLLGIPGASLTGSETHDGWTAGFGFEHALGEWVTARVEYSHVDLGTENHALTGGGIGPIDDNVDAEIDSIRVGASIKLGN